MAASTGPVLAIGAITVTNEVIFHSRPIDWRVPIATGVAALVFAGFEKAIGRPAVLMAWGALLTSLVVPFPRDVEPPIEAAVKFFKVG